MWGMPLTVFLDRHGNVLRDHLGARADVGRRHGERGKADIRVLFPRHRSVRQHLASVGASTERGSVPEVRLWIRAERSTPELRNNGSVGSLPVALHAAAVRPRRRPGVLLIGVVPDWTMNSGSAKTDNAQTAGNRAPTSPCGSRTVVRVLVDAWLGTVLIDLSTMSPDTSRTLPAVAQQSRGHLQDQGGVSSGARGTSAPEPSADAAPAAHVAAPDICTFGRGAACPFGRGCRPSDLSR